MSTPLLTGLRIILADDHQMVRFGFRLLIEGAGAAVVAEASTGEQAVSAWESHPADILVMDVSMPGIGGIAALERLRAHDPDARVLMLSAHVDNQIPLRALQAGATGYLSKRAHPDQFLAALDTVRQGRRYLDPELAPQLALAQLGGQDAPIDSLTGREFTVFLQLARGNTVAQIARTLNLSQSTVGTHLYHIKQKLDASNAAELTLIALRAGLLEP